jgi:antitoxin component of MazEF toxin-antitoxin module
MKTAILPNEGNSKEITTEVVSGEDNTIVLPSEYAKALGIKPGDTVQVRLEANNIQIKKRLSIREVIEKYARPGEKNTLERLREERGWNDYERGWNDYE